PSLASLIPFLLDLSDFDNQIVVFLCHTELAK
ncbi:MAG: hypothetical protein ACI85I_002350, partial [Arenicella sp.]